MCTNPGVSVLGGTGYGTRVGIRVGIPGCIPGEYPATGEQSQTSEAGPEALQGWSGGSGAAGATGYGGLGGSCTTLRARSVPLQGPSLYRTLGIAHLGPKGRELTSFY